MLALGIAPTSGGSSSLALRLLAGEGSSGFTGEDVGYADTVCEPLGVERGAFVALGAAGRGCMKERESRGWSVSACWADVLVDRRLMAEGVGVNGGGFKGDSTVDADLRFFLGRGVAGSVDSGSVVPFVSSLGIVVFAASSGIIVTFALRFLAVALVLAAFSYFATPFSALDSESTEALVLATRAERLKDMLCCVYMLVFLVNRVV